MGSARLLVVAAVAGLTCACGEDGTTAGGEQSATGSESDLTDEMDCWVLQMGTAGADAAMDIVLADQGGVFFAGYVSGPVEGTQWFGGRDVVVGRIAPDGSLEWIRQYGTPADDSAYGLEIDGDGHLFVAGSTGGALDGDHLPGNSDLFVMKLYPDGAPAWIRQTGYSWNDVAWDISVDSQGNVLVAGETEGSGEYEDTAGGTDAIVVKYSSTGELLWWEQIGTASDDQGSGVAVDALDNVYVAGSAGTLDNQAGFFPYDTFAAKLDPDGVVQWIEQMHATSGARANGVTVGESGGTVMVGSVDGEFADGGQAASDDAFVASYGPDGKLKWVRLHGTDEWDSATSITRGEDDQLLVAGYTEGDIADTASLGGRDVFVSAYQPDGERSWTQQWGTSGDDWAKSVAIRDEQTSYVAGFTTGAFDGFVSGGLTDLYIARLCVDP